MPLTTTVPHAALQPSKTRRNEEKAQAHHCGFVLPACALLKCWALGKRCPQIEAGHSGERDFPPVIWFCLERSLMTIPRRMKRAVLRHRPSAARSQAAGRRLKTWRWCSASTEPRFWRPGSHRFGCRGSPVSGENIRARWLRAANIQALLYKRCSFSGFCFLESEGTLRSRRKSVPRNPSPGSPSRLWSLGLPCDSDGSKFRRASAAEERHSQCPSQLFAWETRI